MSVAPTPAPIHPIGTAGEVTVNDWPLVHAPWSSALLAVGIAMITLLAAWGSGSWVMSLCALLALTSATWRQWVPVRLVIDNRGIRQHAFSRSHMIEWTSIGRIQWRQNGVTFFPHGPTEPLMNFRGLYVPWENRRDGFGLIIRYHALRCGIEIIEQRPESKHSNSSHLNSSAS